MQTQGRAELQDFLEHPLQTSCNGLTLRQIGNHLKCQSASVPRVLLINRVKLLYRKAHPDLFDALLIPTMPNQMNVFGPLSFVGLLMLSNFFMTFAWYAHLKNLSSAPWWIAVFVSWSIALLEYAFQVPANRIGYQYFSLSQLKITQEVITLGVFIPFAMFYMNEPFKTDYIWAGCCLLGAVYFVFRS